MAIYKPSWLRNLLDRLNWDVFTWKIYVGDAIESGIDWALGWINYAIDWAVTAYNWGKAAWDKAVEVGNELVRTINTEISRVRNKIDTWWGDLGEWFEGKKPTIEGWIAVALTPLRLLLSGVETVANAVSIAWDDFKTDTLPKLLDPSWITSFFGAGIASISDWWAARHQEITDRIDTEVTPVRDEVNRHTSWLDLVKDLFTDPEKWLLDMIERMITRFL